MKNARLILIVLCVVSFSTAQEKKSLTFDQIFKNSEPKLIQLLPTISSWADDDHYLETKKKDGIEKVYSVDALTGKETLYRDINQYKTMVDSEIVVDQPATNNKDYDKLIYAKENDLYYLNVKNKLFKRLTNDSVEEKNPTISPDGNFVAFTRDHNLFTIDLKTGTETQYTFDGNDVVYNGWAAWIYYEEIFGRPSKYKAFWWSPDSRHIVFYRFDEKDVPVFPLYNAEGQHGSLENTRYPKAGDKNPEVKFGIITVEDKKIVWGDFNEKDDQYFGEPFWTPNGDRMITQWMNRQQDTLILYSIDLVTGKRKTIYTEHQPTWVDWVEKITFLKNGKEFFIQSDKSGWMHIYHFSIDGKLINQVTDGKWAVANILYVDEEKKIIYFTARKEVTTNTDFYKINFNGKKLTRLTSGDYSHSVNISPKGKYFISTYSNISTPSCMAIFDNKGNEVRKIANSQTKEFNNYLISKSELFHVPSSDSYNLPVKWTLPINFDETKKYPVLISVYGGPGSYDVSNRWDGIRSQWLAMEGIIQMSIDHRGSLHFGKEGSAKMHRQLGTWEMHDYIEVAKWLCTQPFIDTSKICITGGSYGGYVAALALTYGADYFTHGIASYSVIDYKLYDSHYTERFMDSPSENPDGYKNTSVLTWTDRYKGLLRIVHGTMDDNVHMQNILQLVSKLEDSKKHFELMIYPGGRHGWGGPKATHLRNENYRFYYKYLLEKNFPDNLFN
ncbi:MAG: S9 family peptidase [Ignavibacteriales bacterium]|nr:S9 family peptidase [Ignavibacteriales bacterium]